MPQKKANYEDKFSGRTRGIIMTLTRIFLDSGLDIREKHMFGHKAFLLRGNVMMLVGEWARKEMKKTGTVDIADKGKIESTLIIMPRDVAEAESFRSEHGGYYFAPGGTRLKNWLSFSGAWLTDEDALLPVVESLLATYSKLPAKAVKNPGRLI